MTYPLYIIEAANRVLTAGREVFTEMVGKYIDEIDYELEEEIPRLCFYLEQREAGVTHSLAAMTAMQSAPRCMTDREFLQGMGTLNDQFDGDEKYLKRVVASARSQGYNPSANDVYMANLAKFPGDKDAFVKGRGDIQRVCEERGLPSDGVVKLAGREQEPKKVKLAPDIVDRMVREKVRRDPSLKKVSRKELKQEIVNKHGAKK